MGFIFEQKQSNEKDKQKALGKKKAKNTINKSVANEQNEQKQFELQLQQYV